MLFGALPVEQRRQGNCLEGVLDIGNDLGDPGVGFCDDVCRVLAPGIDDVNPQGTQSKTCANVYFSVALFFGSPLTKQESPLRKLTATCPLS